MVSVKKIIDTTIQLEGRIFMRFCSKCGTQIEKDQKFCRNCGQAVSNENVQQVNNTADAKLNGNNIGAESGFNNPIQDIPVQNNPVQNISVESPKMRKKLSKKSLISIIVAAAIFVFCISAYFIGASINSKKKVVARMTEAINDADGKKLAKYLVSSDDKLEINEESLKPFVEYLKDKPDVKKALVSLIETQAKFDKKSGKQKVEDLADYQKETDMILGMLSGYSNLGDLFTLKKQGKSMIFYDKYVLELNPVYLEINTNRKDSKIYLNDKEVATAKEDDYTAEIGPYVPGEYTIKVSLDGEYVNAEESEKVDLVSNFTRRKKGKNVLSTYLNLYVRNISISSNYEEAKLFVNGSDTGLLIKDIDKFGPLPTNGTVKLQAKMDFPWGTVASEEVAVESSWVDLDLEVLDDKMKDDVIELITAYLKSVNEAFSTLDSSKFANITEKRKEDRNKSIQDLIDENNRVVGGIKKILVDLSSFKISKKDDVYEMRLTVRTFNDSVKYKEGETPPETKLDEYYTFYYLVYDEDGKTWLIDNTDRSRYGSIRETEAKEVIIVEDESQTGDQAQSEDESQEDQSQEEDDSQDSSTEN
jgi:uncharacterized membrane protein YvbJ